MGLLGAVGAGLAAAGEAAGKIGMEQIRAAIEESRTQRLIEFKAEQANTQRQNQAGEIRQGVSSEIDKQFGNQDNALETDDVSPIRKPSRTEALQVRHDVAADLGYDDAAANALKARDTETKADYYGARGKNAEGRLEQGNRRLNINEDLASARIDNLEANTGLAEARTEAVGEPKGLTSVQRVRNLEIDAARKRIEGLDQATIKARTQKFSATGRENKDYDDQLENRVRLANRRKVGDDEWFDRQNESTKPKPAQQTEVPLDELADLADRFIIDPRVRGMTLGRDTEKGREVFDSNGKHVGYYR